jgi:hypothetical protein
VAIFSGIKKMTSEIALCRDHWKYRSKISLPHIALHRYWNSNLSHNLMAKTFDFAAK